MKQLVHVAIVFGIFRAASLESRRSCCPVAVFVSLCPERHIQIAFAVVAKAFPIGVIVNRGLVRVAVMDESYTPAELATIKFLFAATVFADDYHF